MSRSATLSPPTYYSSRFTPKIVFKFHLSPPPSMNHHGKPNLRFLCTSKPQENPTSDRGSSSTIMTILLTIPQWVDEIKEKGMKKKRSMYDHEKWLEHRSSLRHVRHLMSSLGSRVVLSLLPPVIVFTSVAVIVASYNSAVSMDWLPEFFPVLRASSLPYQLTAPALALLLVFRTEASYSRFEEGKKAWTRVVSAAYDLARQVISSVESPRDVSLKNAILQYIVAFPVALKCHLIYASDAAQDLQSLLEAEDLAVVLSSKHRPQCIIEFISQSLQSLDMEPTKRHMLESKLAFFHEGIEVCEQLMGIPIPLSYTRLTSRFLVLWHLTLPIILWDDCHWIVVPATFISAASLFCIEEVGVLIEEPFPMLALEELCHALCNNVEEMMRNERVIKARVRSRRIVKQHFPNGFPASVEDRSDRG